MNIGIYDKNNPSALTGLFLKMKKRKLYVRDLDNLSSISELDTIIINPSLLPEKENEKYWDKIKNAVKSNLNKKFLIVSSNFRSNYTIDIKEALGKHPNVKYITHRGRTSPVPIDQLMEELDLRI